MKNILLIHSSCRLSLARMGVEALRGPLCYFDVLRMLRR
jgi:hypothetical protein